MATPTKSLPQTLAQTTGVAISALASVGYTSSEDVPQSERDQWQKEKEDFSAQIHERDRRIC